MYEVNDTVGVLCERFSADWEQDRFSRNPLKQLRFARDFKANPRDKEFMAQLFYSHFPGGRILEYDNERVRTRGSSTVLLYQDSIGLGWTLTELNLKFRSHGDLVVLNGRGRIFHLTASTQLRLMLKRSLETSMIPEFIALLVAVPLLPLLIVADRARGRR